MDRSDRYGGGEPPLPKPYAFVSIPKVDARREQPVGHSQYYGDLLTGSVSGMFVALSPVHVASGTIELRDRLPTLVKGHFRCNDRPVIPGSSLKGVIRSIVEAISDPPSCLRITRARIDNIPPPAKPCSRLEILCVACRMFGAMSYLGQVQFSDAVLEQGDTEIIQIPSLFAPRPREQVYFDRQMIKGRKFYVHGQDGKTAQGNVPIEVCPVGSRFKFQIQFENLNDGQLGLLLAALGQGNPRLTPKLGGGKPACCGSIEATEIMVATISERESALVFETEMRSHSLEELVGSTQMINRDSLTRLGEILAYPGELMCPDRNY